MATKSSKKRRLARSGILKFIILLISGILAFFILVLPDAFSQASLPVEIGDVSSQDILAPYSLTFESEVLTEQARQNAAKSVSSVYLPADPSIGRRQVEQLRTVLYYITTVRSDDYAIASEKISDLSLIETVSLSEDTILQILQINEQRWEDIEFEATRVLEQIMQNTLRDTDIYSAKRNSASLIDFSFPEDHANIVVEIIQPFVTANSLLSAELTDAAVEEAKQAIEPVIRSFIAGETLVRRGQIVRDIDKEALQRYGLIKMSDPTKDVVGAAILTLLVIVVVGVYFQKQQKQEHYSVKALLLIAVTFLVFLSVARFFVIDRTVLPYVYPLAAFGLTLAAIFNFEIAAFFSVLIGIMTAYSTPNGFDLSVFYILSSILGILALGNARRIGAFFLSGITVGLAGVAIILSFRLPGSLTDWIGITMLSGASLINGIAAAGVTLLLQFIFSHFLDMTTALQLLETSRPDHPLLQHILRNAPGSYQHSLQVANLAEQAAEAIGADGLLVRVGAIYHDCGKTRNPQFFIENQIQGELNPHNEIDPVISAQTIINHVPDGVQLGKKYHLPNRILDFIREHHGTMHTHYQYTQALEQAENPDDVDKSLFTYPGPRPQSRETALIMLSDGIEARARAELPKDEEELQALIDTVVDFYQQNNQLEDTDLTLKDLQIIKNSFFRTLKGTYHPRIKYPALSIGKTKPRSNMVSKGG